MSNVLKVSHQEAIRSLHEKGWAVRRIARELGIHRNTVSRHIGSASKCTTISTTGTGSEDQPKCTISTSGKIAGRKGGCEPFAEIISAKVETGLSAQRVYQDLVEERAFMGSYQSVKRYVRKLKEEQPTRVWRMECQPGEEMQVDFGLGAPIEDGNGKTRRSWVFRVVLSHSRKGYSEAVLRQDTETFLRCIENAIRHFGGAPLLINLDNLKAAVLKADWFDPEINPKLAEFCRHYGMSVMPCRPRTPEHKGKVERGIAYVFNNALKGRRFKTLADENQHLAKWEANVADKRIHGTTCKQVAACLQEEKPYLKPLPASLFPCYQEARRSVHRDSYVEVQKSFYEVPPEYIGRQVWVRWDSRYVRVFNDRMEQIQIHTRIEEGRFSRILGVAGLSAPVLSSCRSWINRAGLLGDQCERWAQAAFDARGPEALRAIMGLCNLINKHSAVAIDTACGKAIQSGARRLKDILRLIGEQHEQSAFSFAESHPVIRDLHVYTEFINNQQNDNHHDQQQPQTICPDFTALGAA